MEETVQGRKPATRSQIPALAEPLDTAVRRLLSRDALLEVSFGPGDLVGSNILVGGDGLVLIDWEFGGERPIAFDLAKVHLHCADSVTTQAALERGLHHSVGGRLDHYSFAEQLALSTSRCCPGTTVARRVVSIGQLLELT